MASRKAISNARDAAMMIISSTSDENQGLIAIRNIHMRRERIQRGCLKKERPNANNRSSISIPNTQRMVNEVIFNISSATCTMHIR